MHPRLVAKLGGVSIGCEENGWPRPLLQLAHTGNGAHQLLLGCRGMLTYEQPLRSVTRDRNVRAMGHVGCSWLDTGFCA